MAVAELGVLNLNIYLLLKQSGLDCLRNLIYSRLCIKLVPNIGRPWLIASSNSLLGQLSRKKYYALFTKETHIPYLHLLRILDFQCQLILSYMKLNFYCAYFSD